MVFILVPVLDYVNTGASCSCCTVFSDEFVLIMLHCVILASDEPSEQLQQLSVITEGGSVAC